MAHLRIKKNNYYAEFYDPTRHPARKYVPLRMSDKQAARSMMVQLERRYGHGDYDPWEDEAPVEGVTVQEALEAYLKARSHLRKDTVATDRAVIGKFVVSLPEACLVEHVKPGHVKAFLTAPKHIQESKDRKSKRKPTPRSAATVDVYLARIKTFFSWCETRGWRKGKNPAEKVERPKVGAKMPLFLSQDEYRNLLTAIESDASIKGDALKRGEVTWLADVVCVVVGTGLRASELCHLRWSAIDLKGRRLTVKASPGFQTKNGHERTVPLAGDALATLERLNAERTSRADGYVFSGTASRAGTRPHLDRGYVNKRFKYYAKRAKIGPEHTFHSLRRTYASWLVQCGVDLYVVQKLLGHADIKTTMLRYAHLSPNTLVKAVESVFASSLSPYGNGSSLGERAVPESIHLDAGPAQSAAYPVNTSDV